MSDFVRPSGHQLDPPGVNFPDPSYIGELYEEDDIVYTWTGDRWIVWGGTDGSPGVTQDYVDDNFLKLKGGDMTGPLSGVGGLSSRCGLHLVSKNSAPIAVSSGSSYLPVLSVFGYKSGAPDNRECFLSLEANGNINSEGRLFTKKGMQISGQASIIKRVGQETAGFVLEGRTTDGEVGNLLQVYHNGGSVPDAVNYNGKMTSPRNIVNKEYVDGHVSRKIEALEARIKELEGKFK